MARDERGKWYIFALICSILFFLAAIFISSVFEKGPERNLFTVILTAAGLFLSGVYCRMIYKIPEQLEKDGMKGLLYQNNRWVKAVRNVLMEEVRSEISRQSYDEESAKKSELIALQNQINPHFLYNTLDSIRGQALIDGVEEIADMTEALSAFFRYSISRKGNLVRLRDEIRNVDNYMKIQQFRFEDKFILEKKIECSEQALGCYVPKMILQPIIENAIFHGLELLEGQGKITLRIEETVSKIRIQIADKGKGISDKQLRSLNEQFITPGGQDTKGRFEKRGIALNNVNERIQLYFGKEYGLYIRSAVNLGTQVDITIPKKTDMQILDGKVEGLQ
ncbi:MAG: sensor histidine kinase [Ruminococcus sp.]|jgi:two-component system sensor histidine kinase YesM|nr:sensor histidine kinase [Ruminococcus sp.]